MRDRLTFGQAGFPFRRKRTLKARGRDESIAPAARARQFAEFMFSPQSVAETIRGVYTSLLARDT
jgi:hypothetical protein